MRLASTVEGPQAVQQLITWCVWDAERLRGNSWELQVKLTD